MTSDPFDLQRFVDAQAAVYDQARGELARGAKTSHWMWFVFPQLRRLGRSATAQRYGLADAAEAQAYWQHPLLGPRLKECCALVLAVPAKTALQIFGSPDEMKLRSSMTLFDHAVPDEPVFGRVLGQYFAGRRDPLTTALL